MSYQTSVDVSHVQNINMSTPQSDKAFERAEIKRIIETGLKEDVGPGDVRDPSLLVQMLISTSLQVTSLSTIPPNLMANARFLAKDDGVVSGLAVAEQVLKTVCAHISLFPISCLITTSAGRS